MFLLSLVLFVALLTVVLYYQPGLIVSSVALIVGLFGLTYLSGAMWLILIPVAALLVLLNLTPVRRKLITEPAYQFLQKAMPPMSVTEREAMEAGTTWWEKDLFSGKPDWKKFVNIELPQLSEKEQSFLDNEVETFCGLIDEWQIFQDQDLSPEAWQFLKDKGFFGLIIPEAFGGKDFGPYAQSRIMSKIASRSVTAAVTAMVPNSLGPGELLMKYGTEEQKQHWLPGLADGTEIPCFGLTGPEAGSDAGSIPDTGVVCKGEHEGKDVLGIRLSFSKRWITLAPVATVVGLAFKLRDPDGLLGDSDKIDYGITCALLPATHPGVEIGRRHNPGSPFMNGPVKGTDVFIPVDWIIGGAAMAGKGWRMLIECLGAGRGVSLPALSTASGEMSYLTVGAYSRIRRQFNMEIGKFEGVQEATAEIAANGYTLEAFRQLVTRGLDFGAPAVMTAMAKYHATEMMRTSVGHAMDVVSGRAIQMGPRNFCVFAYRALPVAITVEGANILTRSLMIFGQGAMRCHPYLFDEVQTLQASDKEAALVEFDGLFMKHLGHVFGNIARLKLFSFTRAKLSSVPVNADDFSKVWYQRINHLSAALAVAADVALGVLGGDLKRRELLSARLGDVHSQLFIACSLLKYHSVHPRTQEEDAHAEYALTLALHKAQQALLDFYQNFPSRFIAWAIKAATFPLGAHYSAPSDNSVRELGNLIMDDNVVRQRLSEYVYVSRDPEDAVGRVETTYQMLLALGDVWQSFSRAQAKGELTGANIDERLDDAVAKGIIQQADIEPLKAYDARRFDCLLTDHFDQL
ncbi:acyl-CoA dehydrogenase [Gilvimarinus sp. SDUM040013]|uniref:Acyl-coenzyme A dehydrogenase n=1 Tax=Gilvimarinus gilvus TaxID=3058038 RepID=A0ABU4S4V9_9GAMM|nr:acyl-CoA dehydrogenase [Gilvimarinus sp. SDUM040013]MDO3388096.1 acyl-CoA dehydrogenase [Gilvimarinus sp. SDUM040013]MDX6850329.1 acyl-CoA dehydrogenase [Gilvimarinus sp. SDUM040013]